MFNIVLYQPEIPPNTGNIIRLCVNSGCTLHLIEPLGFRVDDKQLKRAGLDYINKAQILLYPSIEKFLETIPNTDRIFCCTTKASTIYSNINYKAHDTFLFGPETKGLPLQILAQYPIQQKIKIPMTKNGRSLNLATAVGIIMFEAWRQINFQL